MSGSREKKSRLGTEQGYTDPKTAREAAERKKQKRSDRMYAAIGIVFVLVAVFVVVWNSGAMEKTTAATVGGENYSATEVNYYFKSVYSQYANSQYASIFGLSETTDLKTASCPLSQDGQTWYDYLLQEATTQMSAISALNAAAKTDGFSVEDLNAQVDAQIADMDEYLKIQSTTVKEYLKRTYGKGMSESLFRDLVGQQISASEYQTSHSESLTYADSDLTAAYQADTNAYDVVDYEYILVAGVAEGTTDAEGNAVDATAEEQAAALATSRTMADQFYAAFQDGAKLETLADSEDSATYSNVEAGAYSDSDLMNWLFDNARKAGDSTVLEVEGSGSYVVSFSSRYRQEYNTVDVRHILIQPEASTLAEDDENYADDVAANKAAAKTTAEELLAQWKSGEATEDSFAALANEKSSDGGSNTNGGLYEQVAQGDMVEAFNDWIFASGRKTGDSGIVETDYGYHIMYFVGTNMPYWKAQVENNLRTADMNEWYTEKTEDVEVTTDGFGMRFVG